MGFYYNSFLMQIGLSEVVTTNALGSAPYSFVCLSFFSMVYPFLAATRRTNTDPYTIGNVSRSNKETTILTLLTLLDM